MFSSLNCLDHFILDLDEFKKHLEKNENNYRNDSNEIQIAKKLQWLVDCKCAGIPGKGNRSLLTS